MSWQIVSDWPLVATPQNDYTSLTQLSSSEAYYNNGSRVSGSLQMYEACQWLSTALISRVAFSSFVSCGMVVKVTA